MTGTMRTKRLVDLAISVPLVVLTVPIYAGVAVANRIAGDSGPVFYRGTRVGEGGQPFQLLKVRTMRAGAPGPGLTRRDDPRITPVGRVLRRYKLDELPQLWNVVRGEMTLVGPRPEDPVFVDWTDPLHATVFRARPGITGLAQLAYADEESLHVGDGWVDRYRGTILPHKLRLDAWYLSHWSMRLDARILFRTFAAVVSVTRRDGGTRGGR